MTDGFVKVRQMVCVQSVHTPKLSMKEKVWWSSDGFKNLFAQTDPHTSSRRLEPGCGKSYLLFSMSPPLQLLLTKQLGPLDETQRLIFNLLIQQSGFECHLDQTFLNQRRDWGMRKWMRNEELLRLMQQSHWTIILFCIIVHSDFCVLPHRLFLIENSTSYNKVGLLGFFWAGFSSLVSWAWTELNGRRMIIPMYSNWKLLTGFVPLGLGYNRKKINCLPGGNLCKGITTLNNELQSQASKYANSHLYNWLWRKKLN